MENEKKERHDKNEQEKNGQAHGKRRRRSFGGDRFIEGCDEEKKRRGYKHVGCAE